VANGRYDYHDIDNDRLPLVYTAWQQAPRPLVYLHVRTDGDPIALSGAVRDAAQEIQPGLPFLAPMTLQSYSSVPFYGSRGTVKVLGILGVVALILASMGLFSVISYGVSLRMREIGIRMALGATPGKVAKMFTGAAARLVLHGIVFGAVAAPLLVALVRHRIPLLPAAALVEYVVPVVVLATCAIVAGFIPARRAASVDPARTLRAE
jgi:ABC-type antimicrobial peptide transport system permease subunit